MDESRALRRRIQFSVKKWGRREREGERGGGSVPLGWESKWVEKRGFFFPRISLRPVAVARQIFWQIFLRGGLMGSVSERRKIARRGGGSAGGGREEGSIFKATAIFDSYSPGLWFWRHLFPDPSSASTHFSPLSLPPSLSSRSRTYVHTCTRTRVCRQEKEGSTTTAITMGVCGPRVTAPCRQTRHQ